jgi:predicted TIM-barrel fold metal-dependent hydrolase
MTMALTEHAREVVARRLQHLLAVRERVVIDADTHPSSPALYSEALRRRLAEDPNYFHGRPIGGEELLRDMDHAGVDMALCWQNPAVIEYTNDTRANFAALRAANAAIAELALRHPTRVIPAGWTDPQALGEDGAAELVRICVEDWGFPIVKMNPAQNAYPIDSPMVLRMVDRIVAVGAVPAFHFGADTEFTPAEGLRTVALRHPDWPVIGVHMGGGGPAYVAGEPLYLAARALGLACRNIFFVLSAKRDTHIESDLITYCAAGAPFAHNIAVASDAPYGRVSWNFGGFRAMFATLRDGASHGDPRLRANPGLFDDAAVRGFMGGNLAALVIGIDRALLHASAARAAA